MTKTAEGTANTRVGFVGLGSQGAPMARRIIDAGYETTLWARRAESLEPFAGSGAGVATSPSTLGEASDVLCVCVVDDAGVEAVLRGPDGALSSMSAGSIVAVHSTVHVDTCRRLAADFPHLEIVDAPVSGGGHQAAIGELVVMVGGADEAVGRCRPIFETFGDPVLHLGDVGAGQLAKILNNALFTAQLGLAAEVFELAGARGLDLGAMGRIIGTGSGRSFAAELVTGAGYSLVDLAPIAGPLLAKDVGLLADDVELGDSALLDAAAASVRRMGITDDD